MKRKFSSYATTEDETTSESSEAWRIGKQPKTRDALVTAARVFAKTRIISQSVLFLENILADGAPRPEDWWRTKQQGDNRRHPDDFRNCGLQAWKQTRELWRQSDTTGELAQSPQDKSISSSTTTSSRNKKVPSRSNKSTSKWNKSNKSTSKSKSSTSPPSHRTARKFRHLQHETQFVLSKPMGLAHAVQLYNKAWYGSSGDSDMG